MLNRYLLDTNILIYYFNGDLAVQSIFGEIETSKALGFYCPISWVELLCYPSLTAEEANLIRDYLKTLRTVILGETVLDCAAEIRYTYRIGLADALIAACALTEELLLVTRNTDDFKRIEGLSLLNPFISL